MRPSSMAICHFLTMPGLTTACVQPRRHLNVPAPLRSRAPAHRQVRIFGRGIRLLSWRHAWDCAPACTTPSVMLKQQPASLCVLCSLATAKASQPPPPQEASVSCPKGYASSCQIGIGQVCDVVTPGCLSVGVQVKGKQCCCCPTSGPPRCGLALSPCTLTMCSGCCADTSSHSCGLPASALACLPICACSQAHPLLTRPMLQAARQTPLLLSSLLLLLCPRVHHLCYPAPHPLLPKPRLLLQVQCCCPQPPHPAYARYALNRGKSAHCGMCVTRMPWSSSQPVRRPTLLLGFETNLPPRQSSTLSSQPSSTRRTAVRWGLRARGQL